MIRILATAALSAALLVLVQEQDVLHRAGLLGSCAQIAAPAGSWGEWWACEAGALTGSSDLSGRSCERMGRRAGYEYWRCPAALVQARAAG